MNPVSPRVSIGIPVFNGEQFIEEAISSVLAQSYGDFELIISDNASTDRTQEICLNYCARDPRIRYTRNESNLGAAANFNKVFALSSGEYFKWLAADAAMEPEAILQCVSVLDADDDVVLVCSKFKNIALDGTLEFPDHQLALLADHPYRRLKEFLPIDVVPIWGLMRRSVLAETGLIQPFVGADFCLVVHLAIKGKFAQIPAHLMLLRRHEDSYTDRIQSSRFAIEGRREAQWFDPDANIRFVLARWNCLFKIHGIITREPLRLGTKASLFAFLWVRLMFSWRRRLLKEIIVTSGAAELLYGWGDRLGRVRSY